jgi:hypothetical protein
MVAGWEEEVKGPWVHHTCCAVHCNCEYVPTEFVRDSNVTSKGGSFSVNVRTTLKMSRPQAERLRNS